MERMGTNGPLALELEIWPLGEPTTTSVVMGMVVGLIPGQILSLSSRVASVRMDAARSLNTSLQSSQSLGENTGSLEYF